MRRCKVPSIVIQQQNVPLCTLLGGDGKPIPLYITSEWRKPLEQLAQAVNALQTKVDAQQARLTAGGL